MLMRAMTKARFSAQISQRRLNLWMMPGTRLITTAVRIERVYMVAVNQPQAGANCIAKQEFSDALAVSRQFAPGACAVDLRIRHDNPRNKA